MFNGTTDISPFTIQVFNLSGQQVLQQTVSDTNEANRSVFQLKSGVYIIKTADGNTRKVFVP
ncbi:MAG: T9SS type A sorting domain-containing protein [Bacteroidota bacterium]